VTWHDLLGIELQLVAIETQPQAIQLAPPSEPSLALTIELHEEWASSTLSLIVPHRSIEPVIDRLSSGFHYGEGGSGDDANPLDAEAVRASLSETEVEVRAEVASVELTIDEVLALGEGDVVTFRAVEYGVETINALFRVYAIDINIDDEGNVLAAPTLISQDA
jgi:flagellar motor switch protein FliM